MIIESHVLGLFCPVSFLRLKVNPVFLGFAWGSYTCKRSEKRVVCGSIVLWAAWKGWLYIELKEWLVYNKNSKKIDHSGKLFTNLVIANICSFTLSSQTSKAMTMRFSPMTWLFFTLLGSMLWLYGQLVSLYNVMTLFHC